MRKATDATPVVHASRLALLCAMGVLVSLTGCAQTAEAPETDLLDRASALLASVPFMDGHNDLSYSIEHVLGGDESRVDLRQPQPELSADIPRLRAGGIGAQFWAAYVASDSMLTGGALRGALRSIDIIHRFIDRYPDAFEWALTADDIVRVHGEGKIASVIGFEGGHAIDNSLDVLRVFYNLGVRYLTLTHWMSTDWADAATDTPRHGGLNAFGERVVREMNRLGMFVDLSHVHPETMRDVLRVSEAPVMFSHSNARAVNAHPRNVPDDVLALLPANGGVIMVNFIASFVPPDGPAWAERRDSAELALRQRFGLPVPERGEGVVSMQTALAGMGDLPPHAAEALAEWERANPRPRGTVADVADHIDHIRSIAGIDHIGIGSDYYTGEPEAMAVGLEDASKYPNLIAELLRRGYTDDDIRKIAGLNILRAMREMERVAARLRAERQPDVGPASFEVATP